MPPFKQNFLLQVGGSNLVLAVLKNVSIEQGVHEVKSGYYGAVRAQYSTNTLTWSGEVVGIRSEGYAKLLGQSIGLQLLCCIDDDKQQVRAYLMPKCIISNYELAPIGHGEHALVLQGQCVMDSDGTLLREFNYMPEVTMSDLMPVKAQAVIAQYNDAAKSQAALHKAEQHEKEQSVQRFQMPMPKKEEPVKQKKEPLLKLNVKREVDFDVDD